MGASVTPRALGAGGVRGPQPVPYSVRAEDPRQYFGGSGGGYVPGGGPRSGAEPAPRRRGRGGALTGATNNGRVNVLARQGIKPVAEKKKVMGEAEPRAREPRVLEYEGGGASVAVVPPRINARVAAAVPTALGPATASPTAPAAEQAAPPKVAGTATRGEGVGAAAAGAQQGAGPGGTFTDDDPAIIEIVERDIVDRDLGVTFDDIASLEEAKGLLNEAVVLPALIPDFFTGIREPWKGVLLFGPPGTGKTLLAKAIATMGHLTFFNCSSASLTSKWRGDSEKIVRCVFAMARHHAPSVVFFDEVDALVSSRGGSGEGEASRRFKAELLSQMDGVHSMGGEKGSEKQVMVLATTNCPWDLDEAMRRRLEKRIYVPLPDEAARRQLLLIHSKGVTLAKDVDLDRIAQALDGYSGADVKLVCRDAALAPMRRAILGKSPEQIKELKESGELDAAIEAADFDAAIARQRGSVGKIDVGRFSAWEAEFGST